MIRVSAGGTQLTLAHSEAQLPPPPPKVHGGAPRTHALSRDTPGVLALVVGRVSAAQAQLSTSALRVVAVQPEGENGLLDHTLVNHLEEGRPRVADRNAGEAQALQPRTLSELPRATCVDVAAACKGQAVLGLVLSLCVTSKQRTQRGTRAAWQGIRAAWQAELHDAHVGPVCLEVPLQAAGANGSRTRMPSNLPAMKARPGSLVASAKVWCRTARLPRVTVSVLKKPDSAPLPYSISKVESFLYIGQFCEDTRGRNMQKMSFACRSRASLSLPGGGRGQW